MTLALSRLKFVQKNLASNHQGSTNLDVDMFSTRYSITLLFNANNGFNRDVIVGIGDYLRSSKVDWDVYLEENPTNSIDRIKHCHCDGIIADCNEGEIKKAVENLKFPVVGVGGSFGEKSNYPDIPYVATDNIEIVRIAYEHLKSKGLQSFAFYGFPLDESCLWAVERERALLNFCKKDGYDCAIYRGYSMRADTWQHSLDSLGAWLLNLPNPVGVICANDVRARQLLQECVHVQKAVPENIAIIGIDDDEALQNLNRVSCSSVAHNCSDIGFNAAKLLHRRIENPALRRKVVTIAPRAVIPRQSTDFKALCDPHVIQAMHYIRQNACRGAKVGQVLDFVGVSRTNLEHRFKLECGHSIHTELHRQKLNRACELLTKSNMSSQKISIAAGYPSLQYMYAVFRKHFGGTPKDYRERNIQ